MPTLPDHTPSPLLPPPVVDTSYQIFPGPADWAQFHPPVEIGAFFSESAPDSFFAETTQDRSVQQQDWVIGVLMVVLLILAMIRKLFPKRLGQLFPAITSNRFVSQLLREESVLSNRASLAMLLVFLLSMSLFLTQAIRYLNIPIPIDNGLGLFAGIALLIAAFLILKVLFYGLSSVLLKTENAMEEYLFHMVVFTNILGLLLLPVSILIAFTGGVDVLLVKAGLILTALFFVFRLAKTLYLGTTTTNFSPFYLIVYLCTLEIAPFLIISNLLKD